MSDVLSAEPWPWDLTNGPYQWTPFFFGVRETWVRPLEISGNVSFTKHHWNSRWRGCWEEFSKVVWDGGTHFERQGDRPIWCELYVELWTLKRTSISETKLHKPYELLLISVSCIVLLTVLDLLPHVLISPHYIWSVVHCLVGWYLWLGTMNFSGFEIRFE